METIFSEFMTVDNSLCSFLHEVSFAGYKILNQLFSLNIINIGIKNKSFIKTLLLKIKEFLLVSSSFFSLSKIM